MRIDYISEKYPILKGAIERIKAYDGVGELFPPQEIAIKKKVLDGKNLILCAGTGSGKTLVGELAALKCILETWKKVLYLVPLRALAMEKYYEFKTKYEPLGVKIALSIGDMDLNDAWIERYHLICCTYEKADSLIRHGAPWLDNIGMLVIDETHDLNLIDRGPTLEIVITRLLKENPNMQVVGLSATIGNPEDLAKWLNSNVVVNDFRPIPLYEGVYYDGKIDFVKKGKCEPNGEAEEPELKISEDIIRRGGQSLIFVNTRREAEATTKRAKPVVQKFLSPVLKNELKKVSNKVLNALEVPTKQCKELANCILYGVSYHHAGLLNSQRKEIEDAYRKGIIKLIVATPTLIAGVNLPSQTVIIRNVRRFSIGTGGMEMWPVSLYKQAVGRAGRIKFDKEGYGILIARSEDEANELWDYYIDGKPESVNSKLAAEPILRVHILALIASGFCKSEKTLLEFFSRTFYAHQYGKLSAVEKKIEELLENLESWGFILTTNGKLHATSIGKRVSELYIDPLTAHYLIECLAGATKRLNQPFSFLQAISNTIEMRPLLSIKAREFSELNAIIAKREKVFLQAAPEEWDLEFDDFLRSVKTAMMFESWINEATEDQILNKFRVAPGEFYGKREIADWLVYSLQELALLLGYKELLKQIRKLRIRIEYGLKEELLPLVRLKSIGRVRARRLYNANIKTLEDLRKIPLQSLSRLIGPSIAYGVKEQLGEKLKKSGKPVKESVQSNLDKFKNKTGQK